MGFGSDRTRMTDVSAFGKRMRLDDCLLSPLTELSISVLNRVRDGLQEAPSGVGCTRLRSGESPSRD
jgi:hypothetical protein